MMIVILDVNCCLCASAVAAGLPAASTTPSLAVSVLGAPHHECLLLELVHLRKGPQAVQHFWLNHVVTSNTILADPGVCQQVAGTGALPGIPRHHQLHTLLQQPREIYKKFWPSNQELSEAWASTQRQIPRQSMCQKYPLGIPYLEKQVAVLSTTSDPLKEPLGFQVKIYIHPIPQPYAPARPTDRTQAHAKKCTPPHPI